MPPKAKPKKDKPKREELDNKGVNIYKELLTK